MKSIKLCNVLIIVITIIFNIVLYGVVIFSKLPPQTNGLIIIADVLFFLLSINYLVFKKECLSKA
jgi:hypothetical protein